MYSQVWDDHNFFLNEVCQLNTHPCMHVKCIGVCGRVCCNHGCCLSSVLCTHVFVNVLLNLRMLLTGAE